MACFFSILKRDDDDDDDEHEDKGPSIARCKPATVPVSPYFHFAARCPLFPSAAARGGGRSKLSGGGCGVSRIKAMPRFVQSSSKHFSHRRLRLKSGGVAGGVRPIKALFKECNLDVMQRAAGVLQHSIKHVPKYNIALATCHASEGLELS